MKTDRQDLRLLYLQLQQLDQAIRSLEQYRELRKRRIAAARVRKEGRA